MDETEDAARWYLGQQLGRIGSSLARRNKRMGSSHIAAGNSFGVPKQVGVPSPIKKSASEGDNRHNRVGVAGWLTSREPCHALDGISEEPTRSNSNTPGIGLRSDAPHLVTDSSEAIEEADLMAVLGDGNKGMKGRTLLKLEISNVHFRIRNAPVLIDINTILQQGQLIALMGESGSGKTTLLNVLGGRASYGRTTGEMRLNNRPYQPRKMRHLLGYVPQAHLVFKELTVYENLAYAAKLRLHRKVPPAKRAQLVDMALDLLGLQSCRHFVCDPAIGERLSGGQMRRVGIGVELVCDPPIMLLDEPTSALDAVNTRLVAAALKNLARRGVMVVASLHQPRHIVYEMLDRLLLLRKGELIFGGEREDALRYFGNLGYSLVGHNPADFFIEVAFGYEFSSRKLRELPECFGLRHVFADTDQAVKTPNGSTVTAETEVRADILGLLWRSWFGTAVDTVGKLMNIIAKQQSDDRRRALAVLQFAQRVDSERFKKKKTNSTRERLGTFMSFRRGGPATGCSSTATTPLEGDESKPIWSGMTSPRSAASRRSQRSKPYLSPSGSDCGRTIRDESPGLDRDGPLSAPPRRSASNAAPWSLSASGVSVPVVEVELNLERVATDSEEGVMTTPHVDVPEGMPLDLTRKVPSGDARTSTANSTNNSSSPGSPPPTMARNQHSIDVHLESIAAQDAGGVGSSSVGTPRSMEGTPRNEDMSRSSEEESQRSSIALRRSRVSSASNTVMKALQFSHRSPSTPFPTPRGSDDLAGEDDEAAPVAQRLLARFPLVGVTRERFREWFEKKDEGFGESLRAELADQVWERAAAVAMESSQGSRRWQFHVASFQQLFQGAPQERQVLPTWTQLRAVMYSWPMPSGEQPGWATHFVVCTQRYVIKLMRTRMRIYLLLVVTGLLGMLCGVLHGSQPPYNDLLIFYLLFNTMFASICATSSIGTFAGDVSFFSHEAASGVSQLAEGLARLLVDLLPLACLTPFFIMPLYSFATLRVNLLLVYLLFSWSLSPLGYIFMLVAPGNATTFTTSVSFVSCAFLNGFFGIKRSTLPDNIRWLLQLSPGYPAFQLVAYGAALGEPLSTSRWAIIRFLWMAEVLPLNGEAIVEFDGDAGDEDRMLWSTESKLNLLVIGLVLRVVTLILFYFRSTFTLSGCTDGMRNLAGLRLGGCGQALCQFLCCCCGFKEQSRESERCRATPGSLRWQQSSRNHSPTQDSMLHSVMESSSSARAGRDSTLDVHNRSSAVDQRAVRRSLKKRKSDRGSLAQGKASLSPRGSLCRAGSCQGSPSMSPSRGPSMINSVDRLSPATPPRASTGTDYDGVFDSGSSADCARHSEFDTRISNIMAVTPGGRASLVSTAL